MTGGEVPTFPAGASGREVDWRTASEFLAAGEYERVAESLREAQLISSQRGDSILADILSATRRICLACNQCQAEVKRYQQVLADATQREHELKQQLQAILDQLSDRRTSDMHEQRAPPAYPTVELNQPERKALKSGERPGLWQRIQSMLGWRPIHQSPQPEAPAASGEVLTAASIQKTETSISAPIRDEVQEAQRAPSLIIYCLGPFRVFQNDQLVEVWSSLKGQSILKYLVTHKGRPIAKDILMDVFWPDTDPSDTRRNLHQAIYSLRQTLRRGDPELQPIQFKQDCYLLNPEIALWLDFEEFEEHIQTGRSLETAGQVAEAMKEYSIAEDLYQGDFLEEDLYEDWPRLQRRHLRNEYIDITERLSAYNLEQGEYTVVIALCQKILVKDRCREEAYRWLMRSYLARGQRHLAVRQYQNCVQVLQEELDLPPSEETTALYRRITSS